MKMKVSKMQNEAMLTWIIPVYNGEKYLAQAIESILRQPCGDFQIIVVDDGSTDRSLEIAKSYTDSRITVLHKENGGVSSARNMGIDYAESRYIAFLDADDVICKGAYDLRLIISFGIYRNLVLTIVEWRIPGSILICPGLSLYIVHTGNK